MATNLNRRLRALEQAVVPEGAYCPTCGYDPNGPVDVNVTFGESEDPGRCPVCGWSPMFFKIEFDDQRESPQRR